VHIEAMERGSGSWGVTALAGAGLLVGGALSGGCDDAARPDFERCQTLQAEDQLETALEACRSAAARSPESAAGKEASALARTLEATLAAQQERDREIERLQREELERQAREATDSIDAAQRQLEALKREVEAAPKSSE
jgi:hypothetical protein